MNPPPNLYFRAFLTSGKLTDLLDPVFKELVDHTILELFFNLLDNCSFLVSSNLNSINTLWSSISPDYEGVKQMLGDQAVSLKPEKK